MLSENLSSVNISPLPNYVDMYEQKGQTSVASSVKQGTIVFRQYHHRSGIDEVTESFSSLNELFELCLQSENPKLVDRVHIEGIAGDGNKHTLTLVFQSVTIEKNV